jgi:hypothetical protein
MQPIAKKIATTGLGTVVIPFLIGMLARQVSPEIIPVCLLVVYVGLFGFYILAAMYPRTKAITASAHANGRSCRLPDFYGKVILLGHTYPLTRRSQKWFRWKSPGIKNF